MNKLLVTAITLCELLYSISCSCQNVGINVTNATPDASAMLDVNSTNTGLLIPRVALTSTTDITTITAAATSLLIYNTATITDITPGYYYWNGTIWVRMLEGGTNDFWKTTGNAGTTVGTNFLGTTDAQDFAIYTNNIERVRVDQNGNVGIGITTPSQMLDVNGNEIIKDTLFIATPGRYIYGGDVNSMKLVAKESVSVSIDNNDNSNDHFWITANTDIDTIVTVQATELNVGIGTTYPDPSAKLEISDTAKGILIPQVALTDLHDAISIISPANSLMIYNPGGGGLPAGYYYNKGTSTSPVWVKVTGDCQLWSSNIAGNYNLRTIVDAARTNGTLDPGVYNCVLRTNNGAHWSGRSFILNANFYIANPTYFHQVLDVVDISAQTSGCWTGGLTSFTGATGAFSFSPGVCVQTITLTCSCQPR